MLLPWSAPKRIIGFRFATGLPNGRTARIFLLAVAVGLQGIAATSVADGVQIEGDQAPRRDEAVAAEQKAARKASTAA